MSSTTITIISLLFPLFAIAVAALIAKRVMKKSGNIRRSFKFNFSAIGIMVLMFMLFSFSASAQGTHAEALALAKAATINSGIGGGLALASGVPAAIGAVSEDPKAFGKALIFVALGETIALYGVVISVLIIQKC